MKEISNPFGEDYEFIEDSDLENLKIKFKVPEEIILEGMKQIKIFEVYSVKDLLDNYQFLSRVSDSTEYFKKWKEARKEANNYEKGFIKEDKRKLIKFDVEDSIEKISGLLTRFEELVELVEYNKLISQGTSLYQTINQVVSLENVYLRDFNFKNKKLYDAVEFDVTDKNNDLVGGIFIYRCPRQNKISEFEKVILEEIVSSNPQTQFNLICRALNEDYPVGEKDGKTLTRGKKLLVHTIMRHYDKGESENDVPYPSVKIDSPLSCLV